MEQPRQLTTPAQGEESTRVNAAGIIEVTNLETGHKMKHAYGNDLQRLCPFMVTQDGPDQSAMMEKRELPPVGDVAALALDEVLREAHNFFLALEWPETRRARRMEEIRLEVMQTGIYTHTFEELQLGARLAWRLSSRCINRIVHHTLQVRAASAASSRSIRA